MAFLQALLLASTLLLWLPLLLWALWLLFLLQAVVLAEALTATYLFAPLTGAAHLALAGSTSALRLLARTPLHAAGAALRLARASLHLVLFPLCGQLRLLWWAWRTAASPHRLFSVASRLRIPAPRLWPLQLGQAPATPQPPAVYPYPVPGSLREKWTSPPRSTAQRRSSAAASPAAKVAPERLPTHKAAVADAALGGSPSIPAFHGANSSSTVTGWHAADHSPQLGVACKVPHKGTEGINPAEALAAGMPLSPAALSAREAAPVGPILQQAANHTPRRVASASPNRHRPASPASKSPKHRPSSPGLPHPISIHIEAGNAPVQFIQMQVAGSPAAAARPTSPLGKCTSRSGPRTTTTAGHTHPVHSSREAPVVAAPRSQPLTRLEEPQALPSPTGAAGCSGEGTQVADEGSTAAAGARLRAASPSSPKRASPKGVRGVAVKVSGPPQVPGQQLRRRLGWEVEPSKQRSQRQLEVLVEGFIQGCVSATSAHEQE